MELWLICISNKLATSIARRDFIDCVNIFETMFDPVKNCGPLDPGNITTSCNKRRKFIEIRKRCEM